MGEKHNFLTSADLGCNFANRKTDKQTNKTTIKTKFTMKQIEKIAQEKNFAAINVGKLSELKDYVLDLGDGMQVPGKVFGGAALQSTGGDFSFQVFAPNTETGFLHTHKSHEELYFFLSGKGEFQVDRKVFDVAEGSVVRVAPEGRRSVRNNGAEPLVMLCVQYRGATFSSEDAADANILPDKVEW